VMRCPRKGCQVMRSVRHGNSFFHYLYLNNKINCKLSLCQILDVVYFFLCETPIKYAETITGRSHSTLVDWNNMCREVCTKVIERRGKVLGTAEEPIQIDEARFAGKHKYNRGRLPQGNRAPQSEDSDVPLKNNRNHGRRIDDPWVFGLKQVLDCRYYYIIHCMQFLSGSTQYFLSNTVDHILIGRSHIGRAPRIQSHLIPYLRYKTVYITIATKLVVINL
jgi:hypothetical protein